MRTFILILCTALAACTPFPEVPSQAVSDAGDTGVDGDSDERDVPEDVPEGDGFNCVGEGGCDDGQFCNGVEVCLPGSPGADDRGCIPGPAPDIDDGIDCTIDGCDEATDTILHDPGECACVAAGTACECTGPDCPEPLGACWHFVCSDALTCRQVAMPASSDCDDGAECTVSDKCDHQGVCSGTPRDSACNNGSWCDGIESCDPRNGSADDRGCAPGDPPMEADEVACTVARCLECEDTDLPCERGLGGGFAHEPTDACDCRGDGDCPATTPCNEGRCSLDTYSCRTAPLAPLSDCDDGDACTRGTVCDDDGMCGGGEDVCGECRIERDCPAPACQRGVCTDGVCSTRPLSNGQECPANCPGVPFGTCWDGACTLPPEGPVGTTDCDDGEDNNCDGFTDAEDAGCLEPDRVLTTGVETAEAGLDATGASLVVAHLSQGTLLPAQSRNTYCVAHRLHYDQNFDLRSSLEDPQIQQGANPVSVVSGAAAADGSLGLRMCAGAIVDIGPMPLPPVGNPGDTFMVEVDVAEDAERAFIGGDRLLIAWRSELLQEEKFVLAVASGPTFGIRGDGRFRFLVDNVPGMNSITVRLAVSAADRCSIVDAVRIYQLPHLAQVGADPAARTYLNWQYGNVTEPAHQAFEDVDRDLFLTISPEGATHHLEGDGVLYGATGLEFEALENSERAVLGFPAYVDHPVEILRANPLILDFAMGSDDGAFADDEILHAFTADADGQLRLVASNVPDDLDWIVHTMDLPHPAAPAHRTLALAPEAQKARETWLMVLAAFPVDHRTDHLVDEVHTYWFQHPAVRDVTIEYQAPNPPSSPALPIRIRSNEPGLVSVRCYWQVPEGRSFGTVESARYEVLFE